jgi:hypothetical protein
MVNFVTEGPGRQRCPPNLKRLAVPVLGLVTMP